MHTVKVRGDYIQGKFVRPRGAHRRIVSQDPGDSGYRIGAFPVYPAHVDKAVSAAQRAARAWGGLDGVQRADILRKFSAEVVNHRDELKELIAAEVGKPLWEAELEVRSVEAQVESEIHEGVRSVNPFKVGEIRWGVEGSCTFRPLGVVAVLGPAISPVHLACSNILPALLAGNAVVFKPSKLVPATGQFIARLFDQIELPPGVFNLLQGDAGIGSELAAHPGVDGVLFTGSILAGKRILQATADMPTKLTALQMGGVCVSLVLDDCDLRRAVVETVAGAFLTTGQQYTSTGVVLVDRAVFDRYAEAFLQTVQKLQVGYAFDPDTFMGPMLTKSARDRFLALQERLDRAGVRTVLQAESLKRTNPGYYVSPSVHVAHKPESLDAIRPGGLSFGPDVVLVQVNGLDEAVELANRNRFSFAAAVFSEDRERSAAVARRLRYGVVNENLATTTVSLRLPLDGTRACGNHRPAGVFAQRNCTHPVASLKAVTPFDPDRLLPNFPRVEG